uniref:Uncharacterized protein n=1 Tax=Strombidium inclinatum TaxID=197538 RepID=A0A7S3IRZ2_9SPIT|mmetsp:Transcript_3442/g.5164  ORF Transcript_3442/g.5164 Transcript_3442/m.5164 type:complete len:145 (+) Transcript_3442:949-1383(+)
MKLLSPLSKTPKNPMEPCFQNMRFHFIFSKMTNLHDLSECGRYFQLLFVEFLELISRFSIAYWEDQESEGITPPESVGDKVQFLLEKLWAPKIKVQDQKNMLLASIANKFSKQIGIKRSSKVSLAPPADEFPPLVRINQEGEDE